MWGDVQTPIQRIGSQFFLPIGDLKLLEGDIFLLAEHWRWPPQEVLRLPVGRRRRAMKWLERYQTKTQEAIQARSTSSTVTFDLDDVEYVWAVGGEY